MFFENDKTKSSSMEKKKKRRLRLGKSAERNLGK